jgi:5-methylcytosine-specific restriction endonuclease McrA
LSQWAYLYNSRAWKDLRARLLYTEPLCRMCSALGLVRAATVADHIKPHRGDEDLFFEGELQPLCETCHNKLKKIEESRGYSIETGADGWPVDPEHPTNRRGGA